MVLNMASYVNMLRFYTTSKVVLHLDIRCMPRHLPPDELTRCALF